MIIRIALLALAGGFVSAVHAQDLYVIAKSFDEKRTAKREKRQSRGR